MKIKDYPKFGTAICEECGRVFDLFDEDQSHEWYYGHDCEKGGQHEDTSYGIE
jgi:hypothetical protein